MRLGELPALPGTPGSADFLVGVKADGTSGRWGAAAALSGLAGVKGPTFLDFGAKGDGTTDDSAAIQTAIDWSINQKKFVYGVPLRFKLGSLLKVRAGATFLGLDLPRDCRMEGSFATAGSLGMLTNEDTTGAGLGTTRPKNVTIRGGDWGKPYTPQADGSATGITYNGNIFALVADNLTIEDVTMSGLGASGRFFIGGGSNFKILRPAWRYSLVTTGAGGCRIQNGDGLIADGLIQCGDDVCQVVQAENGPYANMAVGKVVFRDMRGDSWRARFLVVAMTDQNAGSQPTFTCSTARVDFIRCIGSGYGFGVNLSNIDSTGQIGEVNVIACDVTDSGPAGSTSTPYGIQVDGGSGLARNGKPGIGVVRVIRSAMRAPQKIAMQIEGEVGEIVLDGHTFDPPKQAGGAAVLAKRADRITIRGGTVSPGVGQDAYQFGTVTTTDLVGQVDIDATRVLDVPDTGDALSINYGFNFRRVGAALVRGRTRVEPRAASTFVRFASVNATDSANVRLDSIDLRPITASTKVLGNVTYGSDIVGSAADDLTDNVPLSSIVGNVLPWNGLDELLRLTGAGFTLSIHTIQPTITPTTPRRLTVVVAGNSTVTFLKRVGSTGNLYTPADVALPLNSAIELVWDPDSSTAGFRRIG